MWGPPFGWGRSTSRESDSAWVEPPNFTILTLRIGGTVLRLPGKTQRTYIRQTRTPTTNTYCDSQVLLLSLWLLLSMRAASTQAATLSSEVSQQCPHTYYVVSLDTCNTCACVHIHAARQPTGFVTESEVELETRRTPQAGDASMSWAHACTCACMHAQQHAHPLHVQACT